MANATSVQRWYDYGRWGTPSAFFDGGRGIEGISEIDWRYRQRVLALLEVDPVLSITATLSIDGASGSSTLAADVVGLENTPIVDAHECVVRAVLFENDVQFCCGTGGRDRWNAVARVVVELGLLAFDGSPPHQSVTSEVELDETWIPANLGVVVFVQRGSAGEILNAARATVVDTAL